MTDSNTPSFQPTDVEATRGREQGLGMGARELDQQGDVGNTVAAPEEPRDFQSMSQDADDTLEENTAVLGTDDDLDEDDTGYGTEEPLSEDVADNDDVVEEDEV